MRIVFVSSGRVETATRGEAPMNVTFTRAELVRSDPWESRGLIEYADGSPSSAAEARANARALNDGLAAGEVVGVERVSGLMGWGYDALYRVTETLPDGTTSTAYYMADATQEQQRYDEAH